jgi:hypothetical protein
MRRRLFVAYCLLIGSVAVLALIVDPSDQPIKHLFSSVAMFAGAAAVWFNKKELLYGIFALSAFNIALACIETKNIPAAIGTLIGTGLFALWTYYMYKEIQKNDTSKP